MIRRWSFTRQGAVAMTGLAALSIAALQGQGNAAWLFALLLGCAGLVSWRWNRRLGQAEIHVTGPPAGPPAARRLPVTVQGLPRIWLTAVVQHADGREVRGPSTVIDAPGGDLPLPTEATGTVVAIDASDRWPWGWFIRHRRWPCALSLEATATPQRPSEGPVDFHGLRPWRPGDGLGRVVWRRLHQGLLAKEFLAEPEPGVAPRPTIASITWAPVFTPPAVTLGTLTLLLLGLLVGTLGLARVLPLSLVIAGPALGLARWWWAKRGHGGFTAAVRWAVLLGLGLLLTGTGAVRLNFDSAVPLFVTLAWIKALELDRDREVHVMATLGLFACGAGLLVDGSLTTFAVALGGAALTGAALARHHGGPQTWKPLAVAAPLAGLVFVLLPRPTISGVTIGGGAVAHAGVSSVMTPTAVAANLDDPTPVFRVEGDLEGTNTNDWYWRAHLLWECDDEGLSWRPGIPPFTLDRLRVLPGQPPRPVHCRLTILPEAPVPPALDAPLSAGRGQTPMSGNLLRWRSTDHTPVVELEADLAGHDGYASETALRRALALPTDLDPRIATLGRRWTNDDPALTVEHLRRWLGEEGFGYSTTPGVIEHGLAGFLFERRQGFCAHYAAAGTVLLRCAGVPARVVIGWRGGEWNPLGGYLLVRQRHAHAWCEYWAGAELGWVRLDLTDAVPAVDPATGRAAGPPGGHITSSNRDPSWWDRLRQIPDYIASRWDQMVLGYDADQRNALLADLGGAWWIGAVLVLGLGLILALRHRRHRAPAPERAYQAYVRALAHLGVPREASEGPRDHARRAATVHPHLAAIIMNGLEAHLRLTYARSAQPEDLTRLREAAQQLRRG